MEYCAVLLISAGQTALIINLKYKETLINMLNPQYLSQPVHHLQSRVGQQEEMSLCCSK